MAREYIPVAVERLVRERAYQRCEYCLSPATITSAPFSIEHIHPLARGGSNAEDNLALSCAWCNLSKGSFIDAIDSTTRLRVALFHPRRDLWQEHFRWSENSEEIAALTAVGRVTIATLKLNRSELQNLRRVLVRSELHPPDEE